MSSGSLFAILAAALTLTSHYNVSAETSKRTPAVVRQQYNTVIAEIDQGGDLLIFANVDGLLEDGITFLSNMMNAIPSDDKDSQMIKDTLKRVPEFMKTEGFYAVEGIGISYVPRGDGMFIGKSFISRKPEAAKLPLWRCLIGGEPRHLSGVNYLPKDTVMAQVGSGDLKQLWVLTKDAIDMFGTKKSKEAFTRNLTMASTVVGTDVEQLIGSLGSETLFAIQLATDSTVSMPSGTGKNISLPSPSLLIGFAVTDNSLDATLDKMLSNAGLPIQKETVVGTEVKTINMPIPIPIPVSISFATHKGMLLLGSTKQCVVDAINAYENKNGLATTPAFTKAFAGLPMKNNEISYVSQRMIDTILDVQDKLMKSELSGDMPEMDMMRKIMKMQGMSPSATVIINKKNGILSHGVSSVSGRQLVASATMAPVGIMAAIAIPSFVKARTTAQRNVCLNNLRQIDAAKEQAAMENNWGDGHPIEPGNPDEAKVIDFIMGRAIPTCPGGGTYTVGPIGTAPKCSCPGHSL